jgi:hypothetical protein
LALELSAARATVDSVGTRGFEDTQPKADDDPRVATLLTSLGSPRGTVVDLVKSARVTLANLLA